MTTKHLTFIALASSCLLLFGCLKDTKSYTYSYRLARPVYKTSESVRSAIKNDAAQPISAPGKMYLLDNYIFLNEINKGIHVINNTNPAAPIIEGFVHIPGCQDMAASGNALYADCFTDLLTLDISNPKAIALKTWSANLFPDRRFVNGYKIDSGKVIQEWIYKDTTVTEKWEVNTWRQARSGWEFVMSNYSSDGGRGKAANSTGKGGSMARFAIQNEHLYTVSSNSLQALNISKPFEPTWVKTNELPWGVETIYPFKDKLFIGSTTGMYIFDASNPGQPRQTGTFSHARVCDPVIADENFAYVTLRNGNQCAGFINQLDVVDVRNIFAPKLVKSYPLTNPHGLDKDGNWLFICDGAAGLKLFDATQASAIAPVKTIAMSETFDVICHRKVAIVSAKDGLYQYDYSSAPTVTLLSKLAVKQ